MLQRLCTATVVFKDLNMMFTVYTWKWKYVIVLALLLYSCKILLGSWLLPKSRGGG